MKRFVWLVAVLMMGALTGMTRADDLWTWVSVGDNKGAVKIDTNGVVLAATSDADYTFSGSGRELAYGMPAGALVFTTNQTLTIGGGDATGYDHWRKHINITRGTVISLK